MKDKQETIIALKPNDVIVQIIPEWLKTNSNEVILPDLTAGYTVPLRKFLLEKFGSELCGVMEISSFFINTKINKDLIEELYENNTHFDIYVRQKYVDCCPKVLKIFEDCTFYQQEFAIPEVSDTLFNRYYFTNSKEPWDIPTSKLDNLVPINQYIYDYAVSKAIKDLNKDLKETVNNTVKKIFNEARV